VLAPGSTIGILGGGQLARMLALAAAPLGMKVHVFAPEEDSVAFDVSSARTVADYDDEAGLAAFAGTIDVATYEFENVPADTAAFLAERVPLRPGARALAVTQDRLVEKSFVRDLGVATAPFMGVDDVASLEAALGRLGRPAVLKTRRLGYDGKGQAVIRDGDGAAAAFASIGRAPAILEGFVAFEREVSVVAARGPDGGFRAFDVCENEHRGGILATTTLPARIAPETEAEAVSLARRIAEGLDYVGVLAVEMFVVREGGRETLRVNEIAPRVHNSGHWSIEGAETSQFEQHIRAVCGWPLGPATLRGPVTMHNLIGDDVTAWPDLAAEPGAHLHLYGKREARPGRKMGHVTRLAPSRRD
jgi:5-(carboxyamino)imidazole ribonucleotide synthase